TSLNRRATTVRSAGARSLAHSYGSITGATGGASCPAARRDQRITVGPMERTLFDDEHDLFRSSVRSFIAKELVPHHEDWEAAGIVDREVFRKAGAHGFLGMAAPEEHGGGGVADFRYNVVIAEEIQRGGVNAAGLGWTLHNDICLPYFLTLTTEEQ